jgi:hypothetical protein
LFLSIYLYYEIEVYEIEKLDSVKTGAKCLDGSDYRFNIQKGSGDGETKFILFFDGGAWCSKKHYKSSLESCYMRSYVNLGSSESGLISMIFNFFGKLILLKRLVPALSSDPKLNPSFYNWNKIYLNYCDGRGFIGYNNEAIKYNNRDLYFRGFNNTIGVLNYVKEKYGNDSNSISNIVVSGTSAGGLASLHYSNFIAEYFSPNISVKTISDSGFFLSTQHYTNKKFNFGTLWRDLINETNPILPFIPKCNETDQWRCFLPENFIDSINIPVFLINAEYDSYAICNLFGTCDLGLFNYGFKNLVTKHKITTEQNKINLLKNYEKILTNKPDWTIYSPSCFLHDFMIFTSSWDNVRVKGKTVKEATYDWLNKGDLSTYIDVNEWPDNQSCAYLKDYMYYILYSGLLSDII